MLNLFKTLSVFLFFLLIVQTVSAAPDKVSQTLMMEPASLLDLGCFKTELWLNENLNRQSEILEILIPDLVLAGTCLYNSASDNIELHITFTLQPNPPAINQQTLKRMIEGLYLEIAPNRKLWAEFFLHTGYNSSGFPELKQFTKTLIRKFKIIFELTPPTQDLPSKQMQVSVKLAEQQDGKLVFFDFKDALQEWIE